MSCHQLQFISIKANRHPLVASRALVTALAHSWPLCLQIIFLLNHQLLPHALPKTTPPGRRSRIYRNPRPRRVGHQSQFFKLCGCHVEQRSGEMW